MLEDPIKQGFGFKKPILKVGRDVTHKYLLLLSAHDGPLMLQLSTDELGSAVDTMISCRK